MLFKTNIYLNKTENDDIQNQRDDYESMKWTVNGNLYWPRKFHSLSLNKQTNKRKSQHTSHNFVYYMHKLYAVHIMMYACMLLYCIESNQIASYEVTKLWRENYVHLYIRKWFDLNLFSRRPTVYTVTEWRSFWKK